MKGILATLVLVCMLLCLSACTVVSVSTQSYVDSIGVECYDTGRQDIYEIYRHNGVYYARVPLEIKPATAGKLISVETLSISSEGAYSRFSWPEHQWPAGQLLGTVYVKVQLRRWNPQYRTYEDVGAPNSDTAPAVLTEADFAGSKPILRISSMYNGAKYRLTWDYGGKPYEDKRSTLHYALYPVQAVCLLLDTSLSIALTPIAILLYDLGPM